jgi:hypothetical protein
MTSKPEDIARRMDSLGLWDELERCNWALKLKGVVLPYFCTVIKGDASDPVRVRFLLIEGWQTLHDYIHWRMDANFGCMVSPAEMPMYCLAFYRDGALRIFRHDGGYVPRETGESESALLSRMLWQAYGVMMRLENEKDLPMRYASGQAMFARVETADGKWEDAPLEIPAPRPYVEKIVLSKEDVKRAQDIPFVAGDSLELDFRVVPGIMTDEKRPRSVYVLMAIDGTSGKCVFSRPVSIGAEGGIKALWEALAANVLKELVALGKIPGQIKLSSARTFRMLRPICVEVPLKLSLHDSLPVLDAAFASIKVLPARPRA